MAKYKTVMPDHLIDPRTKGRTWHLKMAKAIWEEWKDLDINSFSHGTERYNRNRLFALGKNSADPYKQMFSKVDNPSESYMNIDWTVPAIIPKFRRITIEKLIKVGVNFDVQAIDAQALNERKNYEKREKANIELRKLLEKAGMSDEILNSGEADQPKTDDALAIKMQFGYKHNDAIDLEQKVDYAFSSQRIDKARQVVLESLFDYGCAGYKDWTDEETGEAKFRWVDMRNFVASPSKDPFFKDALYMGEITHPTISEIRKTGAFEEEDLEEIASLAVGKWGNPQYFEGTDSPYNKAYDDIRIRVLDLNFKSIERKRYGERVNRYGNIIRGKVDWEADAEYEDDHKCWHEAKWIIGTDHVYGFGKLVNQKRKNSRYWDALSDYHVVAPDLYDMDTPSILEQLIPLVNVIIISWFKLQNVIVLAKPKGIRIEMTALENIPLGDGGETLKPLEVVDLFEQTGRLVYRGIQPNGEAMPYAPIEELNNGLGREAEEYFNVIQRYYQMIRDIIGFNDVTDASTPDPRTLNGVAQMAQEATNNAINHLFRAEREMLLSLADSIGIRIHDSIVFKGSKFYENILGAGALKSMEKRKDAIHREYGFVIVDEPEFEDIQDLKMSMEKAIENQQITIADKYYINSLRNIKQRQMYLSYAIKENGKKAQAQAQAQIQANAQAQTQSNLLAEEEKRKTLMLEFELKERLERVKAEEERKTLEARGEIDRDRGIEDRIIDAEVADSEQGDSTVAQI